MEQTTIQLSKDTLSRLKTFKEYARESYEEVIVKLMKLKEMIEPKLTEKAKEDIAKARKEKGIPIGEAIRELGVNIEV